MEETEEELKSFLMSVKEESEKADLKLNIQKLRCGIWSHHFMANREKVETVANFIFLDSRINIDDKIKRCLLLGRKVMTNLAY